MENNNGPEGCPGLSILEELDVLDEVPHALNTAGLLN
jgi:hypothetical protein